MSPKKRRLADTPTEELPVVELYKLAIEFLKIATLENPSLGDTAGGTGWARAHRGYRAAQIDPGATSLSMYERMTWERTVVPPNSYGLTVRELIEWAEAARRRRRERKEQRALGREIFP